MVKHIVYSAIVEAVNSGQLKEPFSSNEFRSVCKGFGEGTYNAFLYKHRKRNPGGKRELFVLASPGQFKLIRPFLYGL